MWKKFQKKISRLPSWVTNPFVVATALFMVWMIFMDDNNLTSQYRKHCELSALTDKKNYYVQQIKETDRQYLELTTNPTTQEKFAREHYRMKKDNEDVFVIVEEK